MTYRDRWLVRTSGPVDGLICLQAALNSEDLWGTCGQKALLACACCPVQLIGQGSEAPVLDASVGGDRWVPDLPPDPGL